MAVFDGINHIALSVRDLTVSQDFYTRILDLLPVLDVGYARVLMQTSTGFTIALVHHPDASSTPFSVLNVGIDHVGLAVADRAALELWEERLSAAGVVHTPIQDTDLGHHLNFRDPDGIALELQAPTEMYAAVLTELRSREVPVAEILARAEAMLGPGLVARR